MCKIRTLQAIFVCAAAAFAANPPGNAYYQHNLVADTPGIADFTDPNLINPWGIATSAASPFWVDDTGTGLSTVYTSTGSISATHAVVPLAGGKTGTGTPTGIIANATGNFAVKPGTNASFIFSTIDGTISAWANAVSPTQATVMIDNSTKGAVYFGLAVSSNTATNSPILYAPNFKSGKVEMYDGAWNPIAAGANAFVDPAVPAGYAPFNIWLLGGKLYVAWAKQNASGTFATRGAGLGEISVFDTGGAMIKHLVSGGQLNEPWGLAIAPANFGAFANDLLVGNFGDGTINAYDPATGAFVGTMQDTKGNNIVLDGLWALIVGNGGNGGDPNAVYFSAGTGGEKHGLLGSLQAAPVVAAGAVGNAADVSPSIAPNTFISIYGANLAATTRVWATKDFNGNNLPTTLDGVTVTVNGKPAFVYYVSPKQVDVLTPLDSATGPVQVVVTNNGLASGNIATTMATFSPAFFLLKDNASVAAQHANGSLIGATTLYPNASTPAKPGETIVLYGTGFGATTPAITDGVLNTSPLPTATTPVVTIGGASATVSSAVMISPGLYQLNVVVPASAADGNDPVVATIGGVTSATGAFVTVLH